MRNLLAVKEIPFVTAAYSPCSSELSAGECGLILPRFIHITTRKRGGKPIVVMLRFAQSSVANAGNRMRVEYKPNLTIMKQAALILISMLGAAGMASASNLFSYNATAAPGTSPSDGVDVLNGNAPVEIWSVTQSPGVTGGGISGDYFGTAFSGETLSGWQMWSSPGSLSTGEGGFIDASTTFAGGALSIGQTVSINFEMRAVDPGREVGVSLLNASGNAITFGIFGGEPDASYPYTGSGYYYSDAGSSYASAGSMSYQYQNEFNIAFTVTGAGTYSAVAGSDSWSGTFSGSLIGMDVYNHGAGNGSDVAFNNLAVVPEPGTIAFMGLGLALLLWRPLLFKRAA